ncbi:MAG: hypothetical protein R3C03_23895 [Pirellulaceae bacterium]
MNNTILNWTGTDEELLTELNRKQFKRVIGDGLVTLPMVAAVSVELAANLNFTLESTITFLRTPAKDDQGNDIPIPTEQLAQASLIDKFTKRLTESSYGLDCGNDSLRSQMTGILVGAGWDQSSIDTVLSIGAVYESLADRALQRDATQQDIADVRAVKAREAMQQKYDGLYRTHVQPALETGTVQDVIDALGLVIAGMQE